MTVKSFDVPKMECLGCGAPNDATTAAFHEYRPNAGDVTVCIYCGHISVFNADLTLRNPTDEEIQDIAGDERILQIQKARAKADIKPWAGEKS